MKSSIATHISDYFYYRTTVSVFLLLTPVILWVGIIYGGSLLSMLSLSFFSTDPFTGSINYTLTMQNFIDIVTIKTHKEIILRTVIFSTLVTICAALIAIPLGYTFVFLTPNKFKPFIFLAILLPLWSSYLVRVYAWKLILAKEGVITWLSEKTHTESILQGVLDIPIIGGNSLSFSYIGTFLVFLYLWLPFMILPIIASIERIPKNVLQASWDLGANQWKTFLKVVIPLIIPGIVAGSIFTFSLTLGDYITPQIVGNSRPLIGQYIYILQTSNGNIPLAAAFSFIPIIVMGVYLIIAKRLGAFDAL
ncbi:MAG: ABC transporter permease [Methylacidiphilales bacterium]|nr:ABC transporter permease [Candidatus Methylacidiphilales bacterium]